VREVRGCDSGTAL
jgi:hypothetical protein